MDRSSSNEVFLQVEAKEINSLASTSYNPPFFRLKKCEVKALGRQFFLLNKVPLMLKSKIYLLWFQKVLNRLFVCYLGGLESIHESGNGVNE